MRHNRMTQYAGVGALAALLAGCGAPSLDEAIVGTWRNKVGAGVTFGPDSAASFESMGLIARGHYRITDGDIVEMSLREPVFGERGILRFRAAVSDAGLELCEPEEVEKPCGVPFSRVEK